ncbi:MAG: sigma-54-dependent Fis family transcriptional regulator [Desulfobacteraceae bacterium]|nr:sigma-54-dependent Fis family transcriptional regulator [Desulfobacteraceae bacterium]
MGTNPQEMNMMSIRKRLAGLRLRLEGVASAWTVDTYESLLQFYVDILPRLMEAERCTIYVIELGTNRICSKFGTGISEKQIEAPREGSVAGRVITTGEGVIENDLDRRQGFHTVIGEETGFITRNMVCVPIRSVTGHGVTGAIQVLNRKGGRPFTGPDLDLLEEVGNYLSMSIESIILNQEIIRISSQMDREVKRFDRSFFLDTPFVAESPAMLDVLDLVHLVSRSPVNVLLQGEHGTGKELIARLIHETSTRRDRAFVAVNCAAIPENLMESEFFGYEKGAFTGADRLKRGRFEEASGGTLMLDEIAELPPLIQPKFLRAIQEGEGMRLGGSKIIKYDLRLVSATNKDLKAEVEAGRFRDDLFFRLFSVEIRIPPLRERREDIVPLALNFLKEVSTRFGREVGGFAPEVLNLFEAYHWPGNVRQLRREVERMVALTGDHEQIGVDKCSRDVLTAAGDARKGDSSGYSIPKQVQDLETTLIRKALDATQGNKLRAAKLLGITRQGLHKKLKRYQIS